MNLWFVPMSLRGRRHAVPAVPPQPQGQTVWAKHIPCPHETGCTPKQTHKTKQKEAFPDPAEATAGT